MRYCGKSILFGGLLFCLTLMFGGTNITLADEIVNKPWVDMDGDGFNDNAPDEDGDAIPDAADPDYVPADSNDEGMTGLINLGKALVEIGLAPDLGTNIQTFGRLDFCTRAISQNRCGFDAGDDFGSEGIGIGGNSGGGCVGGVCR